MSDDPPLFTLMDKESAKAVQEVAKFGTAVTGTAVSAGRALASVSGGIFRNSIGMVDDWVYHQRLRNLDRLQIDTEEILRRRHVKPPYLDSDPALVLPLLDAAGNSSSQELKDLWARLLAAALDPSRQKTVRRSFIDALKQMDPIDARVFQKLAEHENWSPTTTEGVASALELSVDEVTVSFQNLERLGCVRTQTDHVSNAAVSAFGKLLLATLRD